MPPVGVVIGIDLICVLQVLHHVLWLERWQQFLLGRWFMCLNLRSNCGLITWRFLGDMACANTGHIVKITSNPHGASSKLPFEAKIEP